VPVTRDELDTAADATGLELIVLDGLDDAIVGYNPGFGDVEPCVVYDYDKIIEVFVKRGMSYEEACEWVDFNVIGLKVGSSTPLIIKTKF
jgi:hypothetical protein